MTEGLSERIETNVKRRWLPLWSAMAAVVVFYGLGERLYAHPAPFSFIDVRLTSNELEVTAVLHVWDVAYEYGIEDPNDLLDPTILRLRANDLGRLIAGRFELHADGNPITFDDWSFPEIVSSRQSIRLQSTVDLRAAPGHLQLSADLFPYDPNHQTFLNFYEDELTAQAILGGSERDYEYFVGSRQGTIAVLQRFIPAGVHHILIGPDHLLFLIGLLLLGGSWRQLLFVVTAFTIAHSVTLSMAVLNILSPPARLVEPVIALSIVYVGLDNLLARGGKDVRVWIALLFGFIHGFGFASVLREMGLPTGALGWSLFSFNFGVELGQLMVVLVVAVVLAQIRTRSPRIADQIAVVGSVGVIIAGAFWFVERVFFSGGVA